jgi:hypothetical protein
VFLAISGSHRRGHGFRFDVNSTFCKAGWQQQFRQTFAVPSNNMGIIKNNIDSPHVLDK